MQIEYETKVLDIDRNEIENKLRQLWSEEWEEMLMRRWVFDLSDDTTAWIRLRDNGDKTTMTYKKRWSKEIGNTEEIEIVVDDFEKTYELLNKMLRSGKYYQENKRKIFMYTLDSWKQIEFSLDSWPMIPRYLEVESEDEETVRIWLDLLGLTWKDVWDMGVKNVYSKYNIDLHKYEVLKF